MIERYRQISSRVKAKWAALTFLFASILGHINDVPPGMQDQFIRHFQDLIPFPQHRVMVGLILRTLVSLAFCYGLMHAAMCGPHTPGPDPDPHNENAPPDSTPLAGRLLDDTRR